MLSIRRLMVASLIGTCCLPFAAAGGAYGLDVRPAAGPYLAGKMPELGPNISGNWQPVMAFPKLSFINALGALPIPGEHKVAVWEREGRIWSFESREDVATKQLVLDMSKQVQGWDDSGLLGMVFHPDYARNHYLYVWYCWVPPGTVAGNPGNRPRTDTPNKNRLSRFTVRPDGTADANSELVLIEQDCHVIWHKGGGMFFHPRDGFLYLTIGDDEDGSNAQRIDHALFGGLLRLDVDCRGGAISHPIVRQPENGHTANYFIPNSNPFVGKHNVLEEYYGIGLRSPHRMSHDAVTGRTFIGDVGDATREEIDVLEPTDPPAPNFEWPIVEGFRGTMTGAYLGSDHPPILDYDHGEGSAVIGGIVYRGKRWADDLGGRYIFGDNGSGRIWALDERTSPVSKVQLCMLPFGPGPNSGSNYTGLSSFGTDADGELLMCQMSSEGGHLFRLDRQGPPPVRKPFPKLLSQTGAFKDTAKMVPSDALLPYTVNAPLWSDGAAKRRWMALPAGATITAPDKGDWQFPSGTVFVKSFELPIDEAHPDITRRLETRLLVIDATGAAYGVTYKWRLDNSDADLLPNSLTEDITIRTADGGTRKQAWYYPSQTDCMRCHSPAANYVLGPKTRQLNGEYTYSATGIKDNQLRVWNHLKLLAAPLDESRIAGLDRMAHVSDATASDELRVRSYLDANCANCHRPGGVHALWDARFETPLTAMNILNAAPINHAVGPIGSRMLKAGDVEHSLLHARVASVDPLMKMPPLARNRVDPAFEPVLAHWIATMPSIGALPSGWIEEDIGQVGFAGNTVYLNNAFSVTASGSDIWDNADSFHYVQQALHGDGTIVARVASIGDGDGWIKVGVMIRESADPSGRHAMIAITHDQGAAFQRRANLGGESTTTTVEGIRAPFWIKLSRQGNMITGFISPDGADWRKVENAEIALPVDSLIGLALTSHNNGASVTALFEQVKITHEGSK